MHLKSRKTMRTAVSIIVVSIMLAGCSPFRELVALTRSTGTFVPFAADETIRVQPGADHFAERLAPYVREAIEKVEVAHYLPFSSRPAIYVCATEEDFYRLTGRRVPATVTNKLYLSPDLFQGQRALDRYLTHELSHLHLVQRVGLFGGTRLPGWFKEGLAELASGGATASSVAVQDAFRAINEGHRFVPDEGRNVVSSFLFPRYGSYWHIENRMFYRQSMLFVEFMRTWDEKAFHRFLVTVEGGTKFKKAVNDAYPGGVSMLWDKFLHKSRAMTG